MLSQSGQHVPIELIYDIYASLSFEDIMKTCNSLIRDNVNRMRLKQVCKEDRFWKYKFSKDYKSDFERFRDNPKMAPSLGWLESYRRKSEVEPFLSKISILTLRRSDVIDDLNKGFVQATDVDFEGNSVIHRIVNSDVL